MGDLTLHRLHPDTPESWTHWPAFEARARRFCETHATDTQAGAMIPWLRKLFVETPGLLGAWLALDGDGHGVGHLLGWVDLYFGVPVIFVHQAQMDGGTTPLDIGWTMARAIEQWKDDCNEVYARAGSPQRLTTVRWSTEKNPEAWRRMLEKYGGRVQRVLSTVSWELP